MKPYLLFCVLLLVCIGCSGSSANVSEEERHKKYINDQVTSMVMFNADTVIRFNRNEQGLKQLDENQGKLREILALQRKRIDQLEKLIVVSQGK